MSVIKVEWNKSDAKDNEFEINALGGEREGVIFQLTLVVSTNDVDMWLIPPITLARESVYVECMDNVALLYLIVMILL